ncbi:MAG: pyridoxal phosphate-dependent decarboxylase family protein, partial [Gemmata sp.]
VGALSGRPASAPDPPHGAVEAVREPLPDRPTPYDELLGRVFDQLLAGGLETAGPGYLAYMPSGGLLHAAVADLIAAAVNRYVGNWAACPGLVELEATVVRWFADLVGYPTAARGYLASGGSVANFSAVLTARHARLGESLEGGTAYGSDVAHHSMMKAMRMAGFPDGSFRQLASDAGFRLPPEAVRDAVRADRRRGLRPFLLVANAGTTLTGAVDDLPALAEVAREEGLWLHADAAYGGFFRLTDRGRVRLAGLDRTDSVTLDPHKSLFLPYGTGALVVRDGDALRKAHRSSGQLYSPRQEHPDRVDFCEYSPELTRGLRGLRVWLPLKMHGAGAFRRYLDEKLDLARWAAGQVRAIDGVELVAEPVLSVVVFRLTRPDAGAEELDALNQRLLDSVNARRRVLLTGVTLRGRFALRLCVLSFRTHRENMEHAVEDIRAAVGELG